MHFWRLIPKLTLDRLAKEGLRWTRFHVTALCSPIACARSGILPWIYGTVPKSMAKQPWELYDLDKDYSEADNLAAQCPDRLKQL